MINNQKLNPNTQTGHLLTETALLSCGFEPATRSSTPRQIWNIHPHSGTAMRDALIYGNNLMLQLHDLIEKDCDADRWSFVHILITDGHDTDSRASYQQTRQLLGRLRGDMNVRHLRIIILGVDIEFAYAQSLRNLISAAGIHGQYHDITHTDISEIFHRIRTNMGIAQRSPINNNLNNMNNMAYKNMPNMNNINMANMNRNVNNIVNQNINLSEYYAVLFTLDISGSMAGHKWDVTRHAVVDFLRYLGQFDIVSAIVFNDYPHLVMHWNTRQNQMKLGQLGQMQPFQQVMNFGAYYDPNQFNVGQGGQGGYNNGAGLRQPLQGGGRYVVQDSYANDDCCC